MYRWNSRGYNNIRSTRSKSNLSDSKFSPVISLRLRWIWNTIKALSILPLKRACRKVIPINCLLSSTPQPTSSSISCEKTAPLDGSKSYSINNCSNILPCKDIPPQKGGRMAQILSKTMTLLGIAFLIHFIIMSTFAEREGFPPAYDHLEGRYYYPHRSQRSYRNEKHVSLADESPLSPTRASNKSDVLFFTENSTTVTAQIGSETYLPCAVKNLGSGVASWIRRRDYTLLTVGMGTYSNDQRFWVVHNRGSQSFELHIRKVRADDAGVYECQISTFPPASIFVNLKVVEAKAEILGEPDKHVRSGSTFELVCVLRDSTEAPVYVFWFHNEKMINYDAVRGVVVNSDSEKSILTIQDAKRTDSGNYTCFPSNAKPSSISVHILNGEKPAAMQHGSGSRNSGERSANPTLVAITLAVILATAWLITTNLNRNLYDQRQADAIPSSPQPIEVEEGNLHRLVQIHQKETDLPHPTTSRTIHLDLLGESRLEYVENKSASADKVDTRLEPAFLTARLRLILSNSRVYNSESYRQNHNRISSETLPFLAHPTSEGKSVPDVETLRHVERMEEDRFNIINSPLSSSPAVTADLALDNFSSSLCPRSRTSYFSNDETVSSTSSSLISEKAVVRNSLRGFPESDNFLQGLIETTCR